MSSCTCYVVVVLGFYVPPTAKVIRRRDLGLKSHPKDWRSPGSNSGPHVYKAGSLTARSRRLLILVMCVEHIYLKYFRFHKSKIIINFLLNWEITQTL